MFINSIWEISYTSFGNFIVCLDQPNPRTISTQVQFIVDDESRETNYDNDGDYDDKANNHEDYDDDDDVEDNHHKDDSDDDASSDGHSDNDDGTDPVCDV